MTGLDWKPYLCLLLLSTGLCSYFLFMCNGTLSRNTRSTAWILDLQTPPCWCNFLHPPAQPQQHHRFWARAEAFFPYRHQTVCLWISHLRVVMLFPDSRMRLSLQCQKSGQMYFLLEASYHWLLWISSSFEDSWSIDCLQFLGHTTVELGQQMLIRWTLELSLAVAFVNQWKDQADQFVVF